MDILKCSKRCRYYEEPGIRGHGEYWGGCKYTWYLYNLCKKQETRKIDFFIGVHGDNDVCEVAKALITYEKLKKIEPQLIEDLLKGKYDHS